jgi:hypothetical protein
MNAHGILSCAQAERSRKNLAAELKRVTAALREIKATLGPDVPDCCCEGCQAEMNETPYPVAKPTERDRDEGRAVAERLGLLDDARAAQEDAHGD